MVIKSVIQNNIEYCFNSFLKNKKKKSKKNIVLLYDNH